jgi:phytanoyl-CoA hydroxylase
VYNPCGSPAVVSEAITSAYRRDGFVVVRAALDQVMVTACTEHLSLLQARHQSTGPIVTASLTADAFLAGIAADLRLATIAGWLLDAEPVPFGCTYIVKEPYRGLPVAWHQDGYPWRTRLGITEAVTLWVSLDNTGEENGGLRVIPGTHAVSAQPLRPHGGQSSVFGAAIDSGLVDETLARPLTLAPGDLSAHHANLIHGSLPNRSAHLRRALVVRYRPE